MPTKLFDNAACALAATAEDGTLLHTNARFSEWLGFSAVELCGRRFQDLLTMGGRIFHQTHLAPMLRLRGSVTEVKLDMLHRDGHKVTVLLNGTRREQADGAVYDLALFGTTDRDKYERELLNARKLAEALLQEKNHDGTCPQASPGRTRRGIRHRPARARCLPSRWWRSSAMT